MSVLNKILSVYFERVPENKRVRRLFKDALTQIKGRGFGKKRVFISYPWGVFKHENWVRKRLARDL